METNNVDCEVIPQKIRKLYRKKLYRELYKV